MKTKFSFLTILLSAFLILPAAFGQVAPTNILQAASVLTQFQLGQTFTFNGQAFLVTTNPAGQYVIISTGPAGSVTNIPPSNKQDMLNAISQYVSENNPANIGYYGTNDFNLKVGAVYSQNSGQAYASIGVEKFGLLKSAPNFGIGGAVLEGNASGQNGTAGAYATVLYRHPIGDVAITGGLGGGYDNFNKQPMGVLKLDLEYRHSQHLGEYIGLGYAIEQRGAKGGGTDRGMMIGGGVTYSF